MSTVPDAQRALTMFRRLQEAAQQRLEALDALVVAEANYAAADDAYQAAGKEIARARENVKDWLRGGPGVFGL
jgi:hypothetical protein